VDVSSVVVDNTGRKQCGSGQLFTCLLLLL